MAVVNNNTRPPVRKFNLGSVECAVWEKTTQDGNLFYQYSFSKKYRNVEGEWQNTGSFNKSDLAALAALVQRVLFYQIKPQDIKPKEQAAPVQTPAATTTTVQDPDEDIPF